MKRTTALLLLPVLAFLLTSCGTTAQYSSKQQRYQDGIYYRVKVDKPELYTEEDFVRMAKENKKEASEQLDLSNLDGVTVNYIYMDPWYRYSPFGRHLYWNRWYWGSWYSPWHDFAWDFYYDWYSPWYGYSWASPWYAYPWASPWYGPGWWGPGYGPGWGPGWHGMPGGSHGHYHYANAPSVLGLSRKASPSVGNTYSRGNLPSITTPGSYSRSMSGSSVGAPTRRGSSTSSFSRNGSTSGYSRSGSTTSGNNYSRSSGSTSTRSAESTSSRSSSSSSYNRSSSSSSSYSGGSRSSYSGGGSSHSGGGYSGGGSSSGSGGGGGGRR